LSDDGSFQETVFKGQPRYWFCIEKIHRYIKKFRVKIWFLKVFKAKNKAYVAIYHRKALLKGIAIQ
jgi:hypothetical protein